MDIKIHQYEIISMTLTTEIKKRDTIKKKYIYKLFLCILFIDTNI